jgi:aminoglycoside phosphotransferase (APT) family kinase protein
MRTQEKTVDSELAGRLLAYLRVAFDCPGAAYAEWPARVHGGLDAAIYGFRLQGAPSLAMPLILRLGGVGEPTRVVLETAVHNGLIEAGYPAPQVFARESNPKLLGAAFMIMARLAGRPLAQGIEGLGSGFGGTVRLFFAVPATLRRITAAWVETQLRLHALPIDAVTRALRAAGIRPEMISFEQQLARMRDEVEHSALTGLQPGIAWLQAHQPPAAAQPVICHGDFHPLNILADQGQVTGVIDWVNVAIAAPELDIGSTIANIAAVPFAVPGFLRWPVRLLVSGALDRYYRAYRRSRPVDDAAVRYYRVFRSMMQLVAVGAAMAAGRPGSGAFFSEAGIANHIRQIRGLTGITLDLKMTSPVDRS